MEGTSGSTVGTTTSRPSKDGSTNETTSEPASADDGRTVDPLLADEASGGAAVDSEASESLDLDLGAGVDSESGAVVPVPGEPLRESKPGGLPGLWRRLAIRRSVRRATALADSVHRDPLRDQVEDGFEAVKRRLDSIEGAVKAADERIEQRLGHFWEIEEQLTQLSEVQDKLADLQQSHAELIARARTLGRTLALLAVLICVLGAAVALRPWLL